MEVLHGLFMGQAAEHHGGFTVGPLSDHRGLNAEDAAGCCKGGSGANRWDDTNTSPH